MGTAVEIRPHRQRNQLAAGLVCALLGATVAFTVLLAIHDPQKPTVFPGWQAIPGAFVQSDLRASLSSCGVSPGTGPNRIGRQVATETRGLYAAAVYTGSYGHYVNSTWCIASRPELFGYSQWHNGTWAGAVWCSSSALALTGTLTAGSIERRSALQTCSAPGPDGVGMITAARGRVGAGVTGVTIETGGHRLVQATIDHGWFIAWWPGNARSTGAEVTTADGRTSFTALSDS